MNLNEARKRVAQVTLGPNARCEDWLAVSENAREFYVGNACQAAQRAGLGTVQPELVLQKMDTFFAQPYNRGAKVSQAFGLVLAELTAV